MWSGSKLVFPPYSEIRGEVFKKQLLKIFESLSAKSMTNGSKDYTDAAALKYAA